MSLKTQLEVMFEMQHAINLKIHPEWVEQNFEWYRAIWLECAEMLDHWGWKWWRHQVPDRDQVVLELVDIFHFGLSLCIDGKTSFADLAEDLETEFTTSVQGEDFKETIELIASAALQDKVFHVSAFVGAMEQVDMSFEELYERYVSKNVLNFFRQENGYNDGTYVKVWDGKEDNEHLIEIITGLDTSLPSFKTDVYNALTERYTNKA